MLWPVRTNYFYVAQSFTYYQKSLIAVFRWAPFNMRCVCMSFVLIIWLISISFHFIISKLLKSYEHNISKSLTIDMSSSAKFELSTFFSTKKNLQRWILKILFISAFFIVYLCELFFFFNWHLLETRHSSQIFEAVLNANLISKKLFQYKKT